MKTIINFMKNETGTFVAICMSVILIVWLWSCHSQVKSLTDPKVLVTRDELKLELDTYLATAKVRFNQLDRQDEFKRTLFESVIVMAQNQQLNPLGILITLAGILGVGTTVDNIGKRRTIRNNAGKTGSDEPPG